MKKAQAIRSLLKTAKTAWNRVGLAIPTLLTRLYDGLGWWLEERRRLFLQILFVVIVSGGFLLEKMIIVVPAGHAAVLWKRFAGGTVEQMAIGEGTILIWPWDVVILYDMRSKVGNTAYHVLSSDGLEVEIQVSYRYIPNPAVLGSLHKLIGKDFARILLEPEVSAATHSVVASYSGEVLYSYRRDALRQEILRRLLQAMEVPVHGRKESLVIFQEFLLSRLSLPTAVQAAIESKEQQRQKAEEYTYIIQREEKESQRRIIEARGIRGFMDEVTPGISPEFLRLQGLKVTGELTRSPNTKIVMIGSAARRTPVIVDTSDPRSKSSVPEEAAPPPPPVTPPPPAAPPGPAPTLWDKVAKALRSFWWPSATGLTSGDVPAP